jgi:group I intron endonuclease
MKSAGIYRIRNTVNDKVYIGQTSNLAARWRTHRHRLRAGTHDTAHLQAAWHKYGERSFVFEILQPCEVEDLHGLEVAAMAAVPTDMLYNHGPAGPSPTLGVRQRESTKLKHSRSKGGRAFLATNETTGEKLRFEHTGEAVAAGRGFRAAHIYSCLHGERAKHLGFSFSYVDGAPARPGRRRGSKPNTLSREVIGTCLVTGVEKRFPFVGAVKTAGFHPPAVFGVLRGLCAKHKGFSWRYADEKKKSPCEALSPIS